MATKIDVSKYPYHLDKIGCSSFDSYLLWCRKNGFSLSTQKTRSQLASETEFVNRNNARHRLDLDNKGVTAKRALALLRSNYTGEIIHPIFKLVSEIYRDEKYPDFLYIDKEMFLDILDFFSKRTKILETDTYIMPLAHVLTKQNSWVKPWDTWKPSTYNAEKQFFSFVRHLFAKYKVPTFFNHVWVTRATHVCQKQTVDHQDWFIQVAQGTNIMKVPGFLEMYPCTKKMAHYFMQAPNDYNFTKAWRFGQVMSMGGTPRLTDAILGSKLNNIGTGPQDEFCLSVIKFFIDNPMLDLAQISPIVDYIWNQKYEYQRLFIAPGQLGTAGVPQPNFSMAGRTVETLLAQVEKWHVQLGKEKKSGTHVWAHSSIKDFELKEGSNETANTKLWRITELLSSKELVAEGRTMCHCVSSYTMSCVSGRSTIWSLTKESFEGCSRHVTIEVTGTRINQIRGLRNCFANQKEMSIINLWAKKEGLSVETSRY